MTEPAATWNPADYARHGRFVADHGAPVVELLAPRPGERILDLGCGDGVLTAQLAAAGARVLGVDSSPAMVAAARARGVAAQVADAAALPFANEFDAVFSNAALHWMPRPADVLAGVYRALRPGGRFVAEMGGHGNVAAIAGALGEALQARGRPVPSPWFFPRADEYRALLAAAGFAVRELQLFPRPTLLPGDVRGWLTTFAGPFTAGLPAAEREAVEAEVTAALRPQLVDAQGRWIADYVRLRFAAERPG